VVPLNQDVKGDPAALWLLTEMGGGSFWEGGQRIDASTHVPRDVDWPPDSAACASQERRHLHAKAHTSGKLKSYAGSAGFSTTATSGFNLLDLLKSAAVSNTGPCSLLICDVWSP